MSPHYSNVSNMDFTIINHCRLCSGDLKEISPFGYCSLANSYPKSQLKKEYEFPLTLCKCKDCHNVQIRETINPNTLFKNYLYSSSDSPTLIEHFKEYAGDIVKRFYTDEYFQVLSIASNDGIELEAFADLGITQLVGIDPAENLCKIAKEKIPQASIYPDFFNIQSSTIIFNKHGSFDVICANNVLAHVENLDEIMRGIHLCLSKDGVLVFENAYLLDTIQQLQPFQIYHEHLNYFGIKPLISYLSRFGFKIFDIKHVDTQNGSFRIYATHIDNQKHKITDNVSSFIKNEDEIGLYSDETYRIFINKIRESQEDMAFVMKYAKDEELSVSCMGCPAKFALFSKWFGLNKDNIKYVVDDSPLKQGLFTPGSKIPIVSRQHFIDNPTDLCIISVPNLQKSIIGRSFGYKGRWVVTSPNVLILDSDDKKN